MPTGPQSYARRYAAKEACAKALGTGFRDGVFWRDIGVVNLPGGKPTLALTGGAAARLAAITPPGTRGQHRRQPHRRAAAGAGDRDHHRPAPGDAQRQARLYLLAALG